MNRRHDNIEYCETCRFRDAHSKQCRRNPPFFERRNGVAECVWPVVGDHAWCAEHEPELGERS